MGPNFFEGQEVRLAKTYDFKDLIDKAIMYGNVGIVIRVNEFTCEVKFFNSVLGSPTVSIAHGDLEAV